MSQSIDSLEVAQALRLPSDRKVLSLEAAVSKIQTATDITHFCDVRGAGFSLLAAASIASRDGPIVCVAADSDEQERLLSDLAYLSQGASVLALRALESNPYLLTQPDRRAAMNRLATLYHLAAHKPFDVLVVTAATLCARLIPRRNVLNATTSVSPNQDLDVGQFCQALVEAGYQRTPLVEDPGTFAVRGSLIDVWAGDAPEPVRIELFGDCILEVKCFDPETQRTREAISEAIFPPVRDLVLSPDLLQSARENLRALCDQKNYPSTKARLLVEELTSGRQSFGTAAYLPAFYAPESIWDYLPQQSVLLFSDAQSGLAELSTAIERAEHSYAAESGLPQCEPERLFLSETELFSAITRHRTASCASTFVIGAATGLERLSTPPNVAHSLAQSDLTDLERAVKQAHASQGKTAALDPFVERLSVWHEHGFVVTAVARTASQARRLTSLLRHREVSLTSHFAESEADLYEVEQRDLNPLAAGAGDRASSTDLGVTSPESWLEIHVGSLSRGVVAIAEKRVLVTEEEIFGHRAHAAPTRKKSKGRAALEDLRSLSAGDFVVHIEHGVGRYLGLENRKAPGGGQLELLVVEYEGGKLFLPVYRLNQVQKWSGGERPKLDRLGGQTFTKTKARAQRRAREMADELLRLYAERHQATRPPLGPIDDEFRTFEAAFPYEETPDQAAAISDVLADLERDQVMDRLVCGDVGFGKTEVALRAAFRAASSGRQVAVLCPTTVLAQQHFLTFSRRLADYPLIVRSLSRFQSKKEATDVLKGLASGQIDIVIGTHRLLSKDLQFKNLGLLVIDEEQRFGVSHKERLKQLRTSVDVLTLTATPIPRTMQLALGGLREMSIISTPPTNRRAIRTIAAKFDDALIKEAIERELSRGGQVFYVYNRVEGLYERAARLQQLVPNARVAVGHGQLNEATLERTMLDFVDGEYDVLVATSIIESGLDIPRANTMLIDRADLFGLAQLYQLRGRVGRSQDRAYCYLLVPAPAEMNDEARSRLEALERYSELGSGYRVATLDMELRGTGDLLGADQSGPVASVGFDLFCQMLEEATRELRGEEAVFDIDPELNFDVEALIPDTYVDEVGIRLSLYKRLASAQDEEEVLQLAREMEDRFGPPPVEALRLVELMRIKVDLRRLRVLVCEGARGSVSFRFRDDTPLNPAKLAQFVSAQKARYRLTPDGKLIRKALEGEGLSSTLDLAERVLADISQLLSD